MCDEIQKHRDIGKRKTIVIVAEGAHDAALKPISASYVKEILSERLGLDTRITQLGHIQRGGRPCAFDRIMVRLTRPTQSPQDVTKGFSLLCKAWRLLTHSWKLLQKPHRI